MKGNDVEHICFEALHTSSRDCHVQCGSQGLQAGRSNRHGFSRITLNECLSDYIVSLATIDLTSAYRMARGKKPQDAAMEAMAMEVMERTARSLMRMSGTNPKLEGCASCTKHNTLDFMGEDQRKLWFQLVDALKTGADGDYQQCAKTCQSISSLSDVHDFTRAHAMIVLYELAKMFDYPRVHFARQAWDSVKRLEVCQSCPSAYKIS